MDVDNRDYHQLSQSEIAGAKRIYQYLSQLDQPSQLVKPSYSFKIDYAGSLIFCNNSARR